MFQNTKLFILAANIDNDTQTFIMDQILEFLISKQRKIADACIHFLITAVKVLKISFMYQQLPLIIKALTLMIPDAKRYSRLSVGYLYKKLCKKFTADEVIKLVPGSDELAHKRLKKIKKDLGRAKRYNETKGDGDDSGDENEFDNLEKKSMT